MKDLESALMDDSELAGFVVMPSEIRDVLNRVKRGAETLALDFQGAIDLVPRTEVDAFMAWKADFLATYQELTGSWFDWRLGFASAADTAERNLSELEEWRNRYEYYTRMPPSGVDPRKIEVVGDAAIPNAIKWAAIGIAAFAAYRLFGK